MLALCVLCTVHVCVLYQYSYVQWLVVTSAHAHFGVKGLGVRGV